MRTTILDYPKIVSQDVAGFAKRILAKRKEIHQAARSIDHTDLLLQLERSACRNWRCQIVSALLEGP